MLSLSPEAYKIAKPFWWVAAGWTILSWLRGFATGSLKVDEHYPQGWASAAIFAMALFLLLYTSFLLYRGLKQPSNLSPNAWKTIVLGSMWLLWPMLPAFSNDLFSLLYHAEIKAHGLPVYTTPLATHLGTWHDYVGERWRNTPFVYGPAALVPALPAQFISLHPLGALLLTKAMFLWPCALLILKLPDSFWRNPSVPLLWLSPLVSLSGFGQVHVDLWLVILGVASLVWAREHPVWAGILLGTALAIKLSALLLGAGFLVHWRRMPWKHIVLQCMAVMLSFLVWYALMGEGFSVIISPLKTLSDMAPTGSFVDTLSEILRFFTAGGNIRPPEPDPIRARALDFAEKGPIWVWMVPLFGVAGIVLSLYSLWRFWRIDSASTTGWNWTLAAAVAILCLAMPKFHPWYLLLLLPYLHFSTSRPWQIWFLWAGGAASLQDFSQVLPHHHYVFSVWVASSAILTLLAFLWKGGARYGKGG